MNQSDVVVAGHICLDIIPAFPNNAAGNATLSDILVPGKLVNMARAVVSTGGPVSNTGLGLMRLGIKTELMGKVGDDLFGGTLLKCLEAYDATEGMVVVPGESTSYTVVVAPPGIDRIFLHHPGANNTFGVDDVNYDLVKQSRLFHLGYPPLMKTLYQDGGAQLTAIFQRVKALGVTTSLDMSLPDPQSPSGQLDWDGVLRRTLPYVDIYLPSLEESLFMLERERFTTLKALAAGQEMLDFVSPDDLRRLGKKLLGYGAGIVALKSGARGFYLITADEQRLAAFGSALPGDLTHWANRELWEESFQAPVVAATGSGDSSIAGFLCAYLHGESAEMSIRYACAVGGQNVQVPDAVSGIKSWSETRAMVAAGWPKNRQHLANPAWHYDDTIGVWIGAGDQEFKS